MRWPWRRTADDVVWVRRKWPWRRPAEGMVWVDEKDLVLLLQANLRARELEVTVRDLRAERRAWELLVEHRHLDTGQSRAELLSDLPLTDDGLHEEAFLALLDRRVWEQRERQLAEQFTQDEGATS